MDTAEIPHVQYICGRWRNAYGDFEHLLDYGGIRYHLLLQFNRNEPTCAENDVLQTLYDAFGDDDDPAAVENAADKCLELLWPFMEADYRSRKQGATGESTASLQALTTNGVLHSASHNLAPLRRFTEPVENNFSPELPIYAASDIERVEEIADEIFRVRVHGSIYCLKTVHRTGYSGDFTREVSILQHCSHPNIVHLIGLMQSADKEDMIEGMLTEYIESPRTLRKIDKISEEEYDLWAAQIKDAIGYLHRLDIVWGDAKAGNILISNNGAAMLIDFGGGATKDWVDKENYETRDGDWQGYQRILDFMKRRVDIK